MTHRRRGELIAEFKDRQVCCMAKGDRVTNLASIAAGFGHGLFMEDTPEDINVSTYMYLYVVVHDPLYR